MVKFVEPSLEWDVDADVAHLVVPIVVISEANQRGFWWSKDRRRREQRGSARLVVESSVPKAMRDRVTHVTLLRYGVRLLDSDNLAGAFKAVRDGIADALGIDDGTIPWHYDQQKSLLRGIRISLHVTSTMLPIRSTSGPSP